MANLGADGNGWEDRGRDVDLVISEGPEGCDVERGVVV